MVLTSEVARYLADVETVVAHVADPTNSDTLADILAMRGDLIGDDMYDDPEVEGVDGANQ